MNNLTSSNAAIESGTHSVDATDRDFSNGNNSYEPYESETTLDFSAIWAAVYRSRLWIAGILLGCLLIGIVISLLLTPIYQAESTVQIDQEAAKVIGTEASELSASIQDSDRFLQTQLDVIRSRTLATTVDRKSVV